MKLYAFTCGWQTGRFRGPAEPPLRVPAPAFLVAHPAGLVLVDAGLHPGVGTDPHGQVGWIADLVAFEMEPMDALPDRLATLGIAPEDLRCVVATHLHYDRAGGLALVPETVELVVQAREWRAGQDPVQAAANLLDPRDYRQPDRQIHLVDGEHDVFGDGRVVLVPTPGHTPGHQSVLLRCDDGSEVFLCGDACEFADWADGSTALPYGADPGQALDTLRTVVKGYRDRGVRMIYGHDPQGWARVAKAPDPAA